jgi:hypothetical protein
VKDVYNAWKPALTTFRAIWRTHVCRGNDFERRKLFLFKGKTSTGNNPSELLPEIDIDAEINLQILLQNGY